MPFTSLGLGPEIARAVREAGYSRPTPIQTEGIPPILEGRDLIGVAQTGTGKTAAFVLPMLERLSAGGSERAMRALIIAPTRELAMQIEENIQAYGRHLPFRSATIVGGVSEKPQIEALRTGVEIVVATPGRLLDLMQQKRVSYKALEFVVLDEADRMLDMGFLPSIRQIMRAVPSERQTLLFSATLSRDIEAIANDFLSNPVRVQIGLRSTPVETVTQIVHEVARERKIDLLLHLFQDPTFESVLVFSRTKHGADKIARRLSAAGVQTATIHANRTQVQRSRALERFKEGAVRVLVATDIAARGIDVDGISHVINFDFPPQPDDYVHRIGRTGRADATGHAISFVGGDDYPVLHRLERAIGRRIPRVQVEGFSVRTESLAPVVPIRATAAVTSGRSFGPRRRSRP
jgi:ATP-dependent RNA helicase RhlE